VGISPLNHGRRRWLPHHAIYVVLVNSVSIYNAGAVNIFTCFAITLYVVHISVDECDAVCVWPV
jgi:hypothetical protein